MIVQQDQLSCKVEIFPAIDPGPVDRMTQFTQPLKVMPQYRILDDTRAFFTRFVGNSAQSQLCEKHWPMMIKAAIKAVSSTTCRSIMSVSCHSQLVLE